MTLGVLSSETKGGLKGSLKHHRTYLDFIK